MNIKQHIARVAVSAVLLGVLTLAPSGAGAGGADKVTICHATGSLTNPFVQVTISASGLNGHANHASDIIPAPAGGCPISQGEPLLDFTASSTVILLGDSLTLTWSSLNTTSCTASNDTSDSSFSGIVPTSGFAVVSPSSDTVYTLTCSGANSSVSGSILITVLTNPF